MNKKKLLSLFFKGKVERQSLVKVLTGQIEASRFLHNEMVAVEMTLESPSLLPKLASTFLVEKKGKNKRDTNLEFIDSFYLAWIISHRKGHNIPRF